MRKAPKCGLAEVLAVLKRKWPQAICAKNSNTLQESISVSMPDFVSAAIPEEIMVNKGTS